MERSEGNVDAHGPCGLCGREAPLNRRVHVHHEGECLAVCVLCAPGPAPALDAEPITVVAR